MPRRFRRYVSWRWWALGILCLVIVGRAVLWGGPAPQSTPFAGSCDVLEVFSGASLLVRPGGQSVMPAIHVRMLGISIPSSQAPAAAKFMRERVRAGEVSLTLDKRRIDSQGNALAYVYVAGRLLNAELVRHGLATVTPYPGDNATLAREMFRAQDLAHAEKLGIWSAGGKPTETPAAAQEAQEE